MWISEDEDSSSTEVSHLYVFTYPQGETVRSSFTLLREVYNDINIKGIRVGMWSGGLVVRRSDLERGSRVQIQCTAISQLTSLSKIFEDIKQIISLIFVFNNQFGLKRILSQSVTYQYMYFANSVLLSRAIFPNRIALWASSFPIVTQTFKL